MAEKVIFHDRKLIILIKKIDVTSNNFGTKDGSTSNFHQKKDVSTIEISTILKI